MASPLPRRPQELPVEWERGRETWDSATHPSKGESPGPLQPQNCAFAVIPTVSGVTV